MTYDQAIAAARRQDVGAQPGPDFMALASAMDARARRRTVVRIAIASAAAVVLVIVGVFMAWSRSQVVDEVAPIDRTPVQAVLERGEAAKREVVPRRVELRRPKLSAAPPVVIVEDEEEPPRERELDADGLYRRAEQAMARRDYAAARKDLRTLLRRFPAYGQRGEATVDYARVEERLGRGQAAACLYARYLAERPTGSLAADARRALDRLARSPSIDIASCR